MPEDLDWDALAGSSQVLVLYMALKHLETIAGRLTGAGRDAATPVAIISNATLPEQRVVVSTLAEAAKDAQAAGIEPPAVIVVGEVVRLRAALDWLGASRAKGDSASLESTG